jgi:hypothetical protein
MWQELIGDNEVFKKAFIFIFFLFHIFQLSLLLLSTIMLMMFLLLLLVSLLCWRPVCCCTAWFLFRFCLPAAAVPAIAGFTSATD